VNASERLESLSRTFSADRQFCDELFRSEAARPAARILVYCHWARTYIPACQDALWNVVPTRFEGEHVEQARFWTLMLLGGVLKDIGLISYLAVRGLMWEAGSVLRRGLESVGVLAHIWQEPAKVRFLTDPDGSEFKDAFQREVRRDRFEELKRRNTTKRFEHLSLGQPASQLFELFSRYGVHGGTPAQLLGAPLTPTRFSCGFQNRPEHPPARDFELLGNGCEIMCVEVSYVTGLFAEKPQKVREGGAAILVWLSRRDAFEKVVDAMLESVTVQPTVSKGDPEN
jgi:hypothetical protein